MEWIKEISNNGMMMVGVITIIILLFLFVYKVEGFIILLEKATGTILQKLCSMIIEAFCLIFKIINALEVYVVLLIDALTGKTTANGKIASLAIGVLSVASFYTTYNGMSVLVESEVIAILITLGIQAILLSTSLLINESLNITLSLNNMKKVPIFVLIAIFGCIVAYVIPIFNMSYSIKNIVVHILYGIVIVASILSIFKIIKYIIDMSSVNHSTSVILFIIYFAVLCVSSFFSYHSFVTVMYPEQVRNVDVFQQYRLGVIHSIESVNAEIDTDYYENIMEELSVELDILEDEIEKFDFENFLLDDEKQVYNLEKAEECIELQKQLEDKNQALLNCYNDYQNEKDRILASTKDIGYYVSSQLDKAEERYKNNKSEIETKILILETELDEIPNQTIINIDQYIKVRDKVKGIEQSIGCSEEIVILRKLLKQSQWTEGDVDEFERVIDKIEESRLYLSGKNDVIKLQNSLEDMAHIYYGYKNYKEVYAKIYKEILNINIDMVQDDYLLAYEKTQQVVYELFSVIPETNYVFIDGEQNKIQTSSINLSDYYSEIETLKRNASPELSQIEKNIRTFVDNKMVGVLCASVAILIDMMILFVGIILPKGIKIPNNTNGKYSDDEVRRILSSLFNKPIGR